MGKRLDRAGGFVVGIALFALGFYLLQPDVIAQTDINKALAAVMTALGIGVVAAAALPRSIEVNGEKFKPLGLNVKASGGAAVFVITLAFIYYMKDEPPGREPDPEPTATSAPATPSAADSPTGTPSPVAGAEPAQTPARPPARQSASVYYAWTYCSACCPNGPDFCAQVGFGEGPDAQFASARAIEECVRNDGIPQTCAANVQYYEENEAPF